MSKIAGGVSWTMTNLDVDDREHQMEEKPLEKR